MSWRVYSALVCNPAITSSDVRYWHKADIGLRGLNVCCGGKEGLGASGLLGILIPKFFCKIGSDGRISKAPTECGRGHSSSAARIEYGAYAVAARPAVASIWSTQNSTAQLCRDQKRQCADFVFMAIPLSLRPIPKYTDV